ncbi:B12-binding domain-containing radical SAM protein [Acidaminobacter hydrogenoformans]|uniref:Radical SAM superfamily enzyme YgiQ, UPF0313 family n=1 Tax=Acidaminobacter hydrogenoformans DSM 2784 TaxID=1120920 RepID=A0A1G5RV15_9FIRM|nr:radical SAM protein [Acidaminobacter hydrogenoformans]SCZ77747.1 Radical SAM superfamily enzyme YgiQ, UPF0313 family [Acidaminobacter hydrogenoformans DSM 2784]
MKIKLIQPAMLPRPMDTQLKTRMAPSLALLTLAALTPATHEVIIENENVEAINFSDAVDLVAITVTVDVMDRAVEISKFFRAQGTKVIAGGIHITADPAGALEHFDAICVGMAERVWPRMLKDSENNTLRSIYRDMDHMTGSEIAPPSYGSIDAGKYLYTNIISASRGCPFKCDFCYNSCENAQKVFITRPVEDVLESIRALRTRHVMFIDDNFIGDPDWTKRFLEAIKPLKLKWSAAVSSNIVDMAALLDLMKETGCQSLFIGFESLNSASINSVHKTQNCVSKYDRLVRALHDRGIMVNASFVFGLDEDDPAVFDNTLKWIVDNKIETVTSHILTPYPGTKLYERFLNEGRITDFNLSRYNTAHVVFRPRGMTAEALYGGYLSLYEEIYSFRNIFKRLPRHKRQWIAYLAFNLFYRKFGKLTERVCLGVSFNTIGKFFRRLAYLVR